MLDFIRDCIHNAQENSCMFKGWTPYEIAADIIECTDTEYTQQDLADGIVTLTITGEISFA